MNEMQILTKAEQKNSKSFYPLQALIVAATLAVVPYVIFRKPVTRIA